MYKELEIDGVQYRVKNARKSDTGRYFGDVEKFYTHPKLQRWLPIANWDYINRIAKLALASKC